ncbi:MAG: iron-containing alcohol dehydrogenase [Bacteriovoracaceae bacterium]
MQNFDFHNPTKILFGENTISRLPEVLPEGPVLLLYGGGSIKSNGVYDQVMKALSGRKVFEVSGVRPNPTYEKAMEAMELIRKEKINFILAVGGGSVVDSAKFISLAVHYTGEPWDILTRQDLAFTKAVPYGAVLTLPATGSEMNCFFVLSRGDQKLSAGHPLLFPQFSILDPKVTFTLDKRQIGNGVVDAFVHVMEQYLTFPSDAPLQDRFAESILSTLIEEGPKSLRNPNDYASRANYMWCATVALSGLVGSGVPHDWSTHAIGHELTALYGLDHAQTLAIVFPAMMWVMKDEKRAKINQYAERVWKISDHEDHFQGAFRKTVAFFENMGLPTKLSAYGIKEDTAAKVIARFETRGFQPMGEKGLVTLEKVREVLRVASQ